jgi:hypothetical protein
MKIKSIISSVLLIAASVMFISVAPVQAGECSAEDPCQTYALVDTSGNVTNVIVCQPSVCGSGEFAGSRAVLQVPSNPNTNTPEGTRGYVTNSQQTVVENSGAFTVTDNLSGTVKEVIPAVKSEKNGETLTVSSLFVDGNSLKINTKDVTLETTTVQSLFFSERQTEEYVELMLMLEELDRLFANWGWFKTSLFGWFL